jgi:hypothetical protein
MLFGEDWEDEMAGLKALRRDVNCPMRNASGKIPGFLNVLKDNVNRQIAIRQAGPRRKRKRTRTL